MTKSILAIASLIAVSLTVSRAAQADVHIDLVAGDLKSDNTGFASVPTGSLLLLISAGPDGVFQNTTSGAALQAGGNYVTADDKIEMVLSINNNAGGMTGDLDAFNFSPTAANLTLGLRWFPGITYAAYEAAVATQTTSQLLASGLYYGTFTGNPSTSINGGDAWITPSVTSGVSLRLNFVTASLNTTLSGTLSDAYPNSAGYASVKVGPVPEPATIALTGVGLLLLAARRRRS